MENLTTINIQVDSSDEITANLILEQLGLDMNTYINMAIKQLINKNGIPFEIENSKPSKELLDALQGGKIY